MGLNKNAKYRSFEKFDFISILIHWNISVGDGKKMANLNSRTLKNPNKMNTMLYYMLTLSKQFQYFVSRSRMWGFICARYYAWDYKSVLKYSAIFNN